MMKKMVRCALLGAAAFLAAACFSKQDFNTQYDTQVLIRFEPDADYQWDNFVNEFFNGGKDTVGFHGSFALEPIFHYARLDTVKWETGHHAKPDTVFFRGGLVISRGKDADASVGRKPSRFAVYDEKGGNKGTKAYAVFHDTTAALMPKHLIEIAIPNVDSYCEPKFMMVHNVQAVYQAVKYGVGLADGPFGEEDYLTLTVTGYNGTSETGHKDVKLVDGTNAIKEWTEVDLSGIGHIDNLQFHLTSSRPDLPLYCAVDDMSYHYFVLYR